MITAVTYILAAGMFGVEFSGKIVVGLAIVDAIVLTSIFDEF